MEQQTVSIAKAGITTTLGVLGYSNAGQRPVMMGVCHWAAETCGYPNIDSGKM